MKAQRAKLNLSMVYEDAPQKQGYITKAFFSKKQAKSIIIKYEILGSSLSKPNNAILVPLPNNKSFVRILENDSDLIQHDLIKEIRIWNN